jgi:hypothetical protein
MITFIISAHNNGTFSSTGSGYGFRIKNSDVKKKSKFLPHNIFISLSNEFTNIKININQDAVSFGEHIIFTKKEIGKWLILNGVKKWDEGHPPKFSMKQEKDNYFKIEKLDT